MKSNKKIISILGILSLVFTGILLITGSVDSKIVTNVPSDISGEELKAVVIDDFEDSVVEALGEKTPKGWKITSTPKQFTKDKAKASITEKKLKMKNPVPVLQIKHIDGKPNDMAFEKWSLTGLGMKKADNYKYKCLGVHFKFKYPGFNSVHILPPPQVRWDKRTETVKTYNPSIKGYVVERGIELPGRAKAISLWVHARGNPYYLEVWVKDYKGNTHILPFGSINFVGWKPMKVYIPSYIPQAATSYPQTRITKITRFVIRSSPNAIPGDVYVFLDQLKVLTETFEVNFDGQKLHDAFKDDSKGGK